VYDQRWEDVSFHPPCVPGFVPEMRPWDEWVGPADCKVTRWYEFLVFSACGQGPEHASLPDMETTGEGMAHTRAARFLIGYLTTPSTNRLSASRLSSETIS
jgi:hypothetical protein